MTRTRNDGEGPQFRLSARVPAWRAFIRENVPELKDQKVRIRDVVILADGRERLVIKMPSGQVKSFTIPAPAPPPASETEHVCGWEIRLSEAFDDRPRVTTDSSSHGTITAEQLHRKVDGKVDVTINVNKALPINHTSTWEKVLRFSHVVGILVSLAAMILMATGKRPMALSENGIGLLSNPDHVYCLTAMTLMVLVLAWSLIERLLWRSKQRHAGH